MKHEPPVFPSVYRLIFSISLMLIGLGVGWLIMVTNFPIYYRVVVVGAVFFGVGCGCLASMGVGWWLVRPTPPRLSSDGVSDKEGLLQLQDKLDKARARLQGYEQSAITEGESPASPSATLKS